MRQFNATRLLRYETRARVYLAAARAVEGWWFADPITRDEVTKIVEELKAEGMKWHDKAIEYEPR